MLGLMMNRPLLISSLIRHADRCHGDTEIVSRTVEGPIHRYTYRDAHSRSRRLARALRRLGVAPGERVGTLAWNGYRHFELYYARVGHGSDHPHDQSAALLRPAHVHRPPRGRPADLLRPDVPAARRKARAAMPRRDDVDRADRPRAHAAVRRCPTFSATKTCSRPRPTTSTGRSSTRTPRPASATRRAPPAIRRACCSAIARSVLHAYAVSLPDAKGYSAHSVVLPVVPMFHVNAWGIPYAAPLAGAKLVLPGAGMDGASLYELFETEKVESSAGVPTVWLDLISYMQQHRLKFSTLKYATIGGAAVPPAMVRTLADDFGLKVLHGWGMTEMSPVGTINTDKAKHRQLPSDDRFALSLKQGRPLPGVEMKIVDGDGAELPWDGKCRGQSAGAGPVGRARVLPRRRRQSADGRRLVSHRRRRHDRRRRLPADHRSLEGHDQVRRRMDQLDRAREHRRRPSGRGRGRRHRRAPSALERAAAAARRDARPAPASTASRCSGSTKARSPSGRRPTTSCSSTSCRTRPPASCRSARCAKQFKDYRLPTA